MAAKLTREDKGLQERAPSAPAYPDNRTHLMDHLQRVEHMVKAQVIRWRATIATNKPENLWGMVHVTDGEVQAFLNAAPGGQEEFSDETQTAAEASWNSGEQLSARIQQRERNTPPATVLRVLQLERIFSLSEMDRDILLACLLPELDTRFRRLYGYLQDDASRTQPTVELVAAILSRNGNGLTEIRARLHASAPLLSSVLLVMHEGGHEPLTVRSLRVDDRIAAFLMGSDAPAASLAGLVADAEPLELEALIAESHHVERLRQLAEWWKRPARRTGAAVLWHGMYGSGRLASARALATAMSLPLLQVDTARLARASRPWEELVELVFREARLREAALYWPDCETLLPAAQTPGRWDDLVKAAETFSGLVLFGSEAAWQPLGHFRKTPFLRIELLSPSYNIRRRLWTTHLPPASDFIQPPPESFADVLANRFQLTEGQIKDAIKAAQAQAVCRNPASPLLTADDLYEGCRRQSSRRLLTFSRRIEPRSELDFADLVLPETNMRQLREVQHRIRTMQRVYSELGFEHRLRLGRGMVVLFTGSSGTGKTMAAEWLARELGVDLYKADLSSVVSKWVGETEKNLHQVFAEAEGSSAIIFFDEADALFGKRGEVKDARDRWANTEVNYLLQRIEEYAGVVILASNLRQNIDEAFLRRISAMVEFPAPDEAARVRIWQGMFPKNLGRPSDQEIQSLAARVRLAGGSVRNIVLDAVFRAMNDSLNAEPEVTLRHLVLATGREYQKLGRPITKSELGEVFYRWIEEEIL